MTRERCMCGDPECPSCGRAQGTLDVPMWDDGKPLEGEYDASGAFTQYESLIPELPDFFSNAMAKVEQLRLSRRAELERRDRAEWECFMHFACNNSLLRRQAE